MLRCFQHRYGKPCVAPKPMRTSGRMLTRLLREPRDWGTGAGWIVWSSTSSVDCMLFAAWACVDFAQRVAWLNLLAVIRFCVPPNRGIPWEISLVDTRRAALARDQCPCPTDRRRRTLVCRPDNRQKGANEAQRPRVTPPRCLSQLVPDSIRGTTSRY